MSLVHMLKNETMSQDCTCNTKSTCDCPGRLPIVVVRVKNPRSRYSSSSSPSSFCILLSGVYFRCGAVFYSGIRKRDILYHLHDVIYSKINRPRKSVEQRDKLAWLDTKLTSNRETMKSERVHWYQDWEFACMQCALTLPVSSYFNVLDKHCGIWDNEFEDRGRWCHDNNVLNADVSFSSTALHALRRGVCAHLFACTE